MISQDSIYIWRVPLSAVSGQQEGDEHVAASARLASLHELLSAQEKSKAASFRGERHRQEYIVAHAALRTVLGQTLNTAPSSVEITSEAGTKPRLMTRASIFGDTAIGTDLDLRFNLSHTFGLALIGVTVGRELGVDIEWQRPIDQLDSMVRDIMSNEEMAEWKSLSESDQRTAFYTVWTRKEAYLKAIGLGLFRELRDVTIPASLPQIEPIEGNELSPRWQVRDRAGVGTWMVGDISVPSGYSASVSWEERSASESGMEAAELRIQINDLSLEGVGR